jgi:hypothetical protein
LPDWIMVNGKPRPIRSSPGYEVAFEGLTQKDKDYLRQEYGGGYTHTADRKSRQERINAAADRTSLHSGARLTPQAQQAQLDKMNERRGIYRRAIY